ncbi:hypothetical protein AYI68_g7707, partial [Smittium mucronatum]
MQHQSIFDLHLVYLGK